jgi:Smg protein
LRDRVLAIVSILAQYVLEDRQFLSEGDIVEELLEVGFEAEEIAAAFSWMENLSLSPPKSSPEPLAVPTQRVFTPEEGALSVEARGFLVRLRAQGMLDDELEEEILDKALAMAEAEGQMGLQELKTLTAFTFFARSQEHWQREVDCIMEEDWTRLYH